jgi:phosphatidylserine/phosphatidylglycerophosphate/cardiolipin synthase-like enzyme
MEALKEEVSSAQAKIDTARTSVEQAETDEEKAALEQILIEQQRQIEQLKIQLNSFPIRFLEVYEHRPLLEQALKDSKERLMIISPWIRVSSVDKRFLQQFESLLKRGVQVFIGYGLGKKDDDKKYRPDIQAEKNLQKLANQYKNNFILKRLGDTHAKILISDAKFAVTTSFNWLSFKGDRDRTFRDERGTLVSYPQKIDELFDSYRSRFDK